MTCSTRTTVRRLTLAIAAVSIFLGACGAEGTTTTADPAPSTDPVPPPAPQPPGPGDPHDPDDPGVIVLDHVRDGDTFTIQVGDRVRVDEGPGYDGIRLDLERDRYGDDPPLVRDDESDTYLAVMPGRVDIEATDYDPDRPCVPPQTVAEATLVVELTSDTPGPDVGTDPIYEGHDAGGVDAQPVSLHRTPHLGHPAMSNCGS